MVQIGIYSSPAPDSSDLDSEIALFLTDQLLTVVKGSRVFPELACGIFLAWSICAEGLGSQELPWVFVCMHVRLNEQKCCTGRCTSDLSLTQANLVTKRGRGFNTLRCKVSSHTQNLNCSAGQKCLCLKLQKTKLLVTLHTTSFYKSYLWSLHTVHSTFKC